MKAFLTLPLAAFLLILTVQAASPPVTRAEFLEALWQSAGGLPYSAGGVFSDVLRDDKGSTAISWAYSLGIVQGTGGGCFSPERPITREEAALLLRRYAGHLGWDTFYPDGVLACNEGMDASPWAGDSLYWATGCGLIDWSPGGRLDPKGTFTPEDLEATLARFFAP